MRSCTVEILDEVNCKIRDLDVKTRRKCVNELKFRLPYAHHLPAVKLGRWDGTVGFFTVGGQTQINLLDRVIPIVEEAGYSIQIQDNRKPFEFHIPHIDKDVISNISWPESHPTNPNEPIQLKEHQVKLINNFLDNLQCIQTSPTGSGKTIVTGTLSKLIEKYGRSIIIVPNKHLVEQTLRDYELLGLDVGVYYGDEKEWNKTHTICTWQSMDRLLKKTKNGLAEKDQTIEDFVRDVACVIIDEVHSAKAEILKKLLTNVLNNVPIRWGLTGTIPKQEFEVVSLLGSIGPVIEGISAKELQEQNILSKCEIDIIQIQETLKFRTYQDENKYLVEDAQRLEWLADFIDTASKNGNTLVLVNRVKSGKELEKMIEDSVFISGAVQVKDRKDQYSEIAKVNNKVIIATYGVAAVGIDIPRIFNLVLFEPGKSFIRTIQSVGRGLRRAKDKDFVQVFDICTSTKYSKKHLTERKKFYKECEYPFKITKFHI